MKGDGLGRDLRHAFRQLRRSPGFAALAVLCLGIGIGANTSIFGALNAILLRPMPVSDPDRVIVLTRGPNGFSYPVFRDFQARSRGLSGLAASFPMESDLEVNGESEFVAAEVVSANYGEVLGVRTSVGRWFTSDTDLAAVISHAVWQNRFNLSPDVVGQRIGSESQSYTIVGVAAREFTGIFGPIRTDLWVPLRTRPTLAALLENRARRPLMLFGRLRPDAAALQAAAELNGIDAQLVAEYGAPKEPPSPIVAEPARGIPNPGSRRLVRAGATLLMAVVGLVLLIACVTAIVLETSTDPDGMVPEVRRALLRMGHGIRVYAVQPLSTHVEQSYNDVRLQATVLTAFGLLALLLAALGLYGVIAYRVSLRTQEIGVRMALGAGRAAIFREVVWQGLAIVLVGLAAAELLTLPLVRAAGSMQAGIRPTAPSTHVAVALIWIGVAFLACYLPAARAARVDPMVALRRD